MRISSVALMSQKSFPNNTSTNSNTTLQSTIHCTQKDSYIQATMGKRSVEGSCETVMCQQDKESTSSQKDHLFELTHQLQELFLNFSHAKITRTPD